MADVFTYCRLCEAICGLRVRLEAGEVKEVAPDPEHPLSRGFICIKGANSRDILDHPDRLLYPLERAGGAWRRRTWDDAFAAIGTRLRGIRQADGPDAIALYLGNPSAMSAVTTYVASAFLRSLGSTRQFSAMSLDNINKFWVAEEMFGDKSFILQRDWEDAKYMLVFGHNPRISIFGQLSSRPRGLEELRAARAQGGRLVLVDPRRTETAGLADEHLQIRPGTDIFFVLALLNVLLEEGRYDCAFVQRYCTNFEDLHRTVAPFTPERVAEATGIDAETTRRIAREFAAAPSGFALGATGVTQQRHATAMEWAIQALNAVSGNIDRPGGAFYNPGVVDEPHAKKSIQRDRPSRIGGYARVLGEYPMTTLADEVLTPGEGQIRALIVVAGNPLATGPDLAMLRKAFAALELVVAIDIFMSVTAEAAQWVLPATTFFERPDVNITFTRHVPFPFIQATDRLVAPRGEAREEWEIFRGLHAALGTPFLNNPALPDGYAPVDFFRDFLKARGHVTYEELERHPHGLKLGDKPIGAFRELLQRRGARIDLCPASARAGLPSAEAIRPATSADYPMLLISRRNLRSLCSWLHVGAMDPDGNPLEMNPEDARRLGVTTGDPAIVQSRTGEIRARVAVTDAVPAGVVSLQFGFGGAGRTTGGRGVETMNVLVDAHEACDRLTGMPTLNGIPVRIQAASTIGTVQGEPATKR